jgi:hypothetical protein
LVSSFVELGIKLAVLRKSVVADEQGNEPKQDTEVQHSTTLPRKEK